MKQALCQVEKKIFRIQTAALVDVNSFEKNSKIVRIDDFCREIEDFRSHTCEVMIKEYEAIVPLLGKIESVVAQSETKSHTVLKEMYHFVEMECYNALVQCIVGGMSNLQYILNLSKPLNHTFINKQHHIIL
ncbi:flagellar inner arm dynein 1 heavy chain alpha [Reticulomyxa filosa]|uniref:Flagellar inner arm dynein 1 heavy chain alpha n=1 Tax=Reticulomyxa filosa TaxID=46433 RepID=X6N5E6_RETFI|nr:flagellar inner arm dynein 1 heavy chain alpha [Reticulomyxa filosa]|eukprot:ETO20532.1 flagellar inner arm dynein 1 heavy chain alpha [Reticulomyxa filosa]